ncbi:MAG: hypothetical protein HGB03_01985 [Candidatus Yonathbacteria bacterium]|nr:hypothetical protein [Candidatus Yonathbacteria bacterium]NTW48028.1 hypothetical protein [Candidatus Yonathbacteria bacterium]
MHKSNGTCRMVFVFPTLGIAIKIPIIQIRLFFKRLYKILKSDTPSRHIYQEIILKWYNRASIKKLLFQGICENLHEYFFYLFFKKRFPIQPTYFSFFGLCNVVKAGKPISLSEIEFTSWRKKIFDIVGRDIEEDNHNFECPENFTRHGNDLFFLDYGSEKTRNFLLSHGKKFFGFFNDVGA